MHEKNRRVKWKFSADGRKFFGRTDGRKLFTLRESRRGDLELWMFGFGGTEFPRWRHKQKFSNNNFIGSNAGSGHDDQLCQKIVEIGAILAIFELFEVSLFGKILTKNHMPLLSSKWTASRDSCELDRVSIQIPGRSAKFVKKQQNKNSKNK